LEQVLGSAAGLSAAAITRLTAQWADDYHAWRKRDLSQVDYAYVWADGIHVNVRLDEDKLCLLVIVGVGADGTKELVALAAGYRESAGSWADLLRGLRLLRYARPDPGHQRRRTRVLGRAARGVPRHP
jgi:transposase-like protein